MYLGYNAEQALQEQRVRELTANAQQNGEQHGRTQGLFAFVRARLTANAGSSPRREAQPCPPVSYREQVQR
jgi:hypothetical protein